MLLPLGESVGPRPWPALLALVVVLFASVIVFWVLVRRWTTHRLRVLLADWAASNKFKLDPTGAGALPPPVAEAKGAGGIIFSLRDEKTWLIQVEATGPALEKGSHWNLLVRRIGSSWPATGLRPVAHRTSVLDAFSMGSFPSLAAPDRFVIFGVDGPAARVLGDSALLGLTPADIGLMVSGGFLVLDFSTRPFDTIELARMNGIAEQLAANLPSSPSEVMAGLRQAE